MKIIKLTILIFLFFECVFIPNIYAETTNAKAINNNVLVVGSEKLGNLLSIAKHSAPANIISLNHSLISSEITGRAVKIYTETGRFVKKGENLVSLDCHSYLLIKKQAQAALKLAVTQLNHAKKQFRRSQNLLRQGTIPREVYDKAEAAQLTALADIELKKTVIESADLTIQRCLIKAPFSGQITKRLVQKGQLVNAGTPLLKLMQSYHKEVKSMLSPQDVAKLKASPVITFLANKKKIKIKLRSVIQDIDEQTRTQEIRLSLPKNTKLAAGLSGRIEWVDTEKQLSPEFVLRRDNQLGIMIAKDIVEGIGKARFIPLADAKEGQAVRVSLSPNTNIITTNRYRVQTGDTVQIQNQ